MGRARHPREVAGAFACTYLCALQQSLGIVIPWFPSALQQSPGTVFPWYPSAFKLQLSLGTVFPMRLSAVIWAPGPLCFTAESGHGFPVVPQCFTAESGHKQSVPHGAERPDPRSLCTLSCSIWPRAAVPYGDERPDPCPCVISHVPFGHVRPFHMGMSAPIPGSLPDTSWRLPASRKPRYCSLSPRRPARLRLVDFGVRCAPTYVLRFGLAAR